MNKRANSESTFLIRGDAHIFGDNVNTDIHCSSKYMPGKDNAYIARHAFEKLDENFANRFKKGDVLVAGTNFGINSSREQAAQIMRSMGVSAIVARSFGRPFFRNAINNGLVVIECETNGIETGDDVEIDLESGTVSVPNKRIIRTIPPLPKEIQTIIASGGLIPFLKSHPNWEMR